MAMNNHNELFKLANKQSSPVGISAQTTSLNAPSYPARSSVQARFEYAYGNVFKNL